MDFWECTLTCLGQCIWRHQHFAAVQCQSMNVLWEPSEQWADVVCRSAQHTAAHQHNTTVRKRTPYSTQPTAQIAPLQANTPGAKHIRTLPNEIVFQDLYTVCICKCTVYKVHTKGLNLINLFILFTCYLYHLCYLYPTLCSQPHHLLRWRESTHGVWWTRSDHWCMLFISAEARNSFW